MFPKIKFTFLLMLFALGAMAQIGMNMSVEHQRFLKYEPIELHLSLRNYSGNTLVFGEDVNGAVGGRLVFSVTAQSGSVVGILDPKANPMAGMVFAPGEVRELTVTLNALFDLQKDDHYTVTAYIDHKRMAQGFASNDVSFEVREGTAIKVKTIGLPASENEGMIKTVTAALMRFNDGEDDIYCLRIDDEKCVYGTFRIGPYIIGSEPQLDADAASAIHVLVQLRPRIYSYAIYAIVNGEAKLRLQRYYAPDNGVPELSRATGYMKVVNAKQAIEGVDFKTK